MNTLIYLVVSIVLNVLPYGANQPEVRIVSENQENQVCEKQYFKLEDLRSQYVITKEEMTQNLVRIKVETISTN